MSSRAMREGTRERRRMKAPKVPIRVGAGNTQGREERTPWKRQAR